MALAPAAHRVRILLGAPWEKWGRGLVIPV